MTVRRVTRFRPRRSSERNPGFWRRVQLRWGAGLLAAASLPILILLAWAPLYWATDQITRENAAWGQEAFVAGGRVEEHWVSLPQLEPFQDGGEPHVRAFLDRQPLLTGLMERRGRRLWLRNGHRLVPATDEPEAPLYRGWIKQAEEAQRFQFAPFPESIPEPDHPPALVLLGDTWVAVKRWRPGTPEVERALREVFPEGTPHRFGLALASHAQQSDLEAQDWGKEPNLQADPARLVDRWFSLETKSDALGRWLLVVIPTGKVGRPMTMRVWKQFWIAAGISTAIGTGLGLGLWLRRRARLRATLDADRLATLTHSLKTPLAILKFRCDSIRLGRLTPEQEDEQLMKISGEVDHLTLMIEHGLDAIRGHSDVGPQSTVSAGWLAQVAEDLAPAFDAEGRTLELEFSSDLGRAALPSLRSALLTLLENALYHGRGTVRFQASRTRRRFQIQVRDEGPGLAPHQIEALGKPFMRLRTRGQEGFQREGQGLGLSLLVQVAQKEGWGLSFQSAPGEGLTATVEIPAI